MVFGKSGFGEEIPSVNLNREGAKVAKGRKGRGGKLGGWDEAKRGGRRVRGGKSAEGRFEVKRERGLKGEGLARRRNGSASGHGFPGGESKAQSYFAGGYEGRKVAKGAQRKRGDGSAE